MIILSTVQNWRFHETVHMDYYTYIESMRAVGKPRATRCLRENADGFRARGDIMRGVCACGVGR